MHAAQTKYQKAHLSESAKKKVEETDSKKTHKSTIADQPAGGLDGNAPRAESMKPNPSSHIQGSAVMTTTGNVDELANKMHTLERSIEAVEVLAGRLEQLALQKHPEVSTPMNLPQVQGEDQSSTLAGRLDWVTHRINVACERAGHSLGRIQAV